MSQQTPFGPAETAEDEEFQPLYARVLGLRHVQPGGLLCLVYFEGSLVLGCLLALAELIAWWGILVLPVMVAVMVKFNDVVAGAVERSATVVPEREQERFRRELDVAPAIGRSPRPVPGVVDPGVHRQPGAAGTPGRSDPPGGTTHAEEHVTTRAALSAPTMFLETVPGEPGHPMGELGLRSLLTAPTVLLNSISRDGWARWLPSATKPPVSWSADLGQHPREGREID